MKRLSDSFGAKHAMDMLYNKGNIMSRRQLGAWLAIINFKIEQITSEDGYASRSSYFFSTYKDERQI